MALIDQAAQQALLDKTQPASEPTQLASEAEAPAPLDSARPDPTNDSSGSSIAPEKVAQMQEALASKVPPNLKQAYDKIVLAGKKVMYAEKSAEMVRKELDRDKPIDQKLAHAAAGLIVTLEKQSKGTMPQDAALLAGACLLLEMVDLVLQIDMPVTEQDVRDALDTFVTLNMMKHGANEQQIMGALGVQGAAPEQAPPEGVPA